MIVALERAARFYRSECQKYGIHVRPSGHAIIYKDVARVLSPYTREADCKREILRYINIAKAEAEQLEKQKQTVLF